MKFDMDERLGKSLSEKVRILGKERYVNTAVLIPLVYFHGEDHLLFQLRSPFIRQGGEICFPGGAHDSKLDASFEDTAVRETMEELGLKREQIKVIGKLGTMIGTMGIAIEAYVGRLFFRSLEELSFNKDEVEDLYLIPINYFVKNPPERYGLGIDFNPFDINHENKVEILLPGKELGFPEKYHKPWKGKKQRILAYRTEFGVIWGITADLIDEFTSFLVTLNG